MHPTTLVTSNRELEGFEYTVEPGKLGGMFEFDSE
jgi:hypothetical protein